MKALYADNMEDKSRCLLCPHHCVLKEGQRGLCKVRTRKKGELIADGYGIISALDVDPIEKKPLYHFYPGSRIFSVGMYGCNLSCQFCQNYHISQSFPGGIEVSPEKLLKMAEEEKDNLGIAFTYNEPLVNYEYLMDTLKLFKEKRPDFKRVLVSNGYLEKEPLKEILPYIDAVNQDIKSMDNDYYKKICGGSLKEILDNAVLFYEGKVHLEITLLMVTDLADSLENVRDLSKFLRDISPDIPLHLSRYFPAYKMMTPATDLARMEEAKKEADKYLNYVYLGNISKASNTYCKNCGELLVEREGYTIDSYLDKDSCPNCHKKADMILD